VPLVSYELWIADMISVLGSTDSGTCTCLTDPLYTYVEACLVLEIILPKVDTAVLVKYSAWHVLGTRYSRG